MSIERRIDHGSRSIHGELLSGPASIRDPASIKDLSPDPRPLFEPRLLFEPGFYTDIYGMLYVTFPKIMPLQFAQVSIR